MKVGEFVPAVIVKVTPVETSAASKAFNVTVPWGMALVVLHVIVAVVAIVALIWYYNSENNKNGSRKERY